jgi:predicted amidohydrolase/GNAT superfamily N-acetyltransferase
LDDRLLPEAPHALDAPPVAPRALSLRLAATSDAAVVAALASRIYPDEPPYDAAQIRGQINAFPEGQFVAEYEGRVVGYAASFRVAEARGMADHSWNEITGGGYGARHDPDGDWLYGMEVCVDPDRRRLRIGQRLYEARKRLAQDLGLKGILFGGRLPGYARRRARYPDPQDYLDAVAARAIRDPVASFQMRAGFTPLRVLRGYLPTDLASGGHAALMAWRNPRHAAAAGPGAAHRRDPGMVRVTTVQLAVRPVRAAQEFYDAVEGFVSAAGDYRSDFVVFPEWFSLQMLQAATPSETPARAMADLADAAPDFVARLRDMAIRFNINIVGGTHPARGPDGGVRNVAYVFLRDGQVHAQEKLHPTPDEREAWDIRGGDAQDVIETDCGPVAVLICYDSEFPELARRAIDQGARVLFVPFCTDTRQGYLRVRYCCQARAVENQCYVVTSGNVGNLPDVDNMDFQYAQSAIFTPCDYPFARDGIAAETSENVEMVAVADLNLTTLDWARNHGSVRNLADRRFDLYRTAWGRSG